LADINELISSLTTVPGFEKTTFAEVHRANEQVTSVRLNVYKRNTDDMPVISCVEMFPERQQVPWSEYGYYLPSRPSFTFDPLFHAGCYYVQEASSMFLEQAVKSCLPDHREQPYRVLDLCAAPGGKATHLSALFPAGIVVANETISSRAGILYENAVRWGKENLVVTSNDPSRFKLLEGQFDLVMVDAPCSGSGMIRKDPDVLKEWSLQNVEHCCKRQQRILEDVWPALREGGILIYATCSYSREEDEDIADWIAENLQAESVAVPLQPDWGIVESLSDKHNCKGYRFFPNNLKGEGLYMSCFRKTGVTNERDLPNRRLAFVNKVDLEVISRAVTDPSSLSFIEGKDGYLALSAQHSAFISGLAAVLQVKKAGIHMGRVINKLLIPDHELAVSCIITDDFPKAELGLEKAVGYLQKKDMVIDSSVKGWCLVTYKGFYLGWVKLLPNRVNNYYPLRFRILKAAPPSL